MVDFFGLPWFRQNGIHYCELYLWQSSYCILFKEETRMLVHIDIGCNTEISAKVEWNKQMKANEKARKEREEKKGIPTFYK